MAWLRLLTLGAAAAASVAPSATLQFLRNDSRNHFAESATRQGAARTGLIVGQITDGLGGPPVADAIVTLTTPYLLIDNRRQTVNSSLPTTPKGRVLTDGNGRFFFADLPPGSYVLQAEKFGYSRGIYGARAPGAGLVYFDLAEGERRSDAVVAIWKNAAITGMVVDEAGEPMVGVNVRAMYRSLVTGEARAQAQGMSAVARTDDRGIYRLTGLIPGEFAVFVPTVSASLPVSIASQFASASPALRFTIATIAPETSPLGSAGNQQIGSTVLVTGNSMPLPPSPQPNGTLDVYPTTFFPSALTAANATFVSIAGGVERGGVNIQMRPVRTARVSGRLLGQTGPAAIRLVPPGSLLLNAVTGASDDAGAFTLLGVPPGPYTLRVTTPATPSNDGPLPNTPVLYAVQSITVGSTDLADLSIVLKPPPVVNGRIDVQGSTSARGVAEVTVVALEPVEDGLTRTSVFGAEDGTFSLSLPPGKYAVVITPPERWHLRAATYEGRDILDFPIDLSADMHGLAVVLTDRPTGVSGVARDARGLPDPHATAVAFPIDPALRTPLGVRRMRSARVSRDGRFTITDLAPGEYFVAARPAEAAGSWRDPATLERLARDAARVRIAADEVKDVDVRVTVIR